MRRFWSLLLVMFVVIPSYCVADDTIYVDDISKLSGNLAENISKAIRLTSAKGKAVVVLFSQGKTYTFDRSIVLYDNTNIDGNGCTIKFNTAKGVNAMFPYNSFITNRKVTSTDGTIQNFKREVYGRKNLIIRDLTFECEGDNQFWFNVNSERGLIALSGCESVSISNISFHDSWKNTPIWITDVKGLTITGCHFEESIQNNGRDVSSGAIWTNGSSYIDNIKITNNTFKNFKDESISLITKTGDASCSIGNVEISSNEFYSKYYAITFSNSGYSGNIVIERNRFRDFDNHTSPLVLIRCGFMQKLDARGNTFECTKELSAISVVGDCKIDSLLFCNNTIRSGGILSSYLAKVSKACIISGNQLMRTGQIMSLTTNVPVLVSNNDFYIANAKGKSLFNINNPKEQNIIKKNNFTISNSDGVMLLSDYCYQYQECQNRLTFENNTVTFRKTRTPFFNNKIENKKITMQITNNTFKGQKTRELRSQVNDFCHWIENDNKQTSN